jgi:hypothetical protein
MRLDGMLPLASGAHTSPGPPPRRFIGSLGGVAAGCRGISSWPHARWPVPPAILTFPVQRCRDACRRCGVCPPAYPPPIRAAHVSFNSPANENVQKVGCD